MSDVLAIPEFLRRAPGDGRRRRAGPTEPRWIMPRSWRRPRRRRRKSSDQVRALEALGYARSAISRLDEEQAAVIIARGEQAPARRRGSRT